MLEKYTAVRDELLERDELVQRASKYAIIQEEVILELRGFIEDLLWGDDDKVIDYERVASKRKYRKGFSGLGKPAIDRALMNKPDDLYKFSLFTSNVQDGDESDDEGDRIRYLQEEIKRQEE